MIFDILITYYAYTKMYAYVPTFSRIYIYICVCVCVCVCICVLDIYIDRNIHFRKLVSDFHITSSLYFEWLGFSSGFLDFQLQLKIRTVTIIHIFYLQLHQRQTPSLHFILTVYHFLKPVTPSSFGVAIQGEP